MSTHKLIYEDQESVELIALRSAEQPYKVVWRLNRALGIKLKKVEEFMLKQEAIMEGSQDLFSADITTPSFEVFTLDEIDAETESLVLVSNKDQGTELFSEAKGFDMVLFVYSQIIEKETIKELLDTMEGTIATRMITCSSYARLNTPFNYFEL